MPCCAVLCCASIVQYNTILYYAIIWYRSDLPEFATHLLVSLVAQVFIATLFLIFPCLLFVSFVRMVVILSEPNGSRGFAGNIAFSISEFSAFLWWEVLGRLGRSWGSLGSFGRSWEVLGGPRKS